VAIGLVFREAHPLAVQDLQQRQHLLRTSQLHRVSSEPAAWDQRSYKPNTASGLAQKALHSRAAHQQLLLVRGASRQRGALDAQLLQQRQPGQDLSGQAGSGRQSLTRGTAVILCPTQACWLVAGLHGRTQGGSEGASTGGRGSPGGPPGT
jgi:hypothetical protein